MTKKGIENFCPLNRVCRQWSDRRKFILDPLFTSYVFIHVTEQDHLKVKQTDGVINIVHWLGKPAVIRDNEIEAIKSFLNKHHNVQLEKVAVNVNDSVRIVCGALASNEGNVIEVMNNTVKVELCSLGYVLVAQVQRNHIEKVLVQFEEDDFSVTLKTLN